LILVAASTKSRKVIEIVQKYLSNISLSTQYQTPAQLASTNPETTASPSNHPKIKSSSRSPAKNARQGFIPVVTTASEGLVLTSKPCPGRKGISVQPAGVSLVGIV
jgi:hypothetical protein